MLNIDSNFQAKECIEREDDIPGDVLGALVKERISKKDCADHVSVITLSVKTAKMANGFSIFAKLKNYLNRFKCTIFSLMVVLINSDVFKITELHVSEKDFKLAFT